MLARRNRADGRWVGAQGREAFHGPAVVFLAAVEDAVVQAVGLALPELDFLQVHAVSAPIFGQGHLLAGVFASKVGEMQFKKMAIRNFRALDGRPGPELAVDGAGVKIRLRLLTLNRGVIAYGGGRRTSRRY